MKGFLSHLSTLLASAMLLLLSCQEQASEAQLDGLWMGSYENWEAVSPLPYLFQFLPDSSLVIWDGEKQEKQNWSIQAGQLLLGEERWQIASLSHHELALKRLVPPDSSLEFYRVLRRPSKSARVPSLREIRKNLPRLLWGNTPEPPQRGFGRQQLFSFRSDSLLLENRYFYNREKLNIREFERLAYHLVSVGDMVFLRYTQGKDSCTRPMAFEQILQLGKNQIATLTFHRMNAQFFNSPQRHHRFLYALPDSLGADSLPDSSFFSPCNLSDLRGLKMKNRLPEPMSDSLKRFFNSRYRPYRNGQEGSIRIRFQVDEKGQAGNLQLEQRDANSRPIHFASQICVQLLELLASYTYPGPPANYQFSFSIKDGKITGISATYL
jgi:hypothetical protein